MKTTSFFCWIATFALMANATSWHNDDVIILVNEQLDPIVDPNGVSGHNHKIAGGSGFGASYDSTSYTNAKCSSLRIQADKSNYWFPSLHWYDNTTSNPFTQIPVAFRFYYHMPNTVGTPINPFPKGLRMIAGSPDNKAATPIQVFQCMTVSDNNDPGSVPLANVQWSNCNGFNCPSNCNRGIKTSLSFPQCWNGKDLYKSDNSHMSYVVQSTDLGDCPFSHPVRIPGLFYEMTWLTYQVRLTQNLNGHLVWSNGDTTGYGLHADFVEGWDDSVLGKALNTTGCMNNGTEMRFEDCSVFQPSINTNAASSCTPDRGVYKSQYSTADFVSTPQLNGCNPLWGSGPKPTNCNSTPPALSPALTGTDGPYTLNGTAAQDWQNQISTAPGYHYVGCFDTNTVFSGNTWYYNDPKLTATQCQAQCASSGYKYAGAVNRQATWQCLCGNTMNPNALYQPSTCTTSCPGNATQNCGGLYKASVYAIGNDTQTPINSKSYDMGCVPDSPKGLLTTAFYNFSSNSMTNEVCNQACVNAGAVWAATYRGNTCFCGKTFNLGDGGFAASSQCTYACTGNKNENCGDYFAGNVFNLTNNANLTVAHGAPAPGYIGCYAAKTSGNALSKTSYSSTLMTEAMCLASCKQLGTTYAAITGGNTCQCGNTTNLGAVLPISQCSSACAGNSSTNCGGSQIYGLYNTSGSTLDLTTLGNSRGAGWQGCYQWQSTSVYNYTSQSMTPAICSAACAQFGYPYAGVSTNRCQCQPVKPTAPQLAYQMCSSPCPGSASQTCGQASTNMDVFLTTGATNTTSNSQAGYYKGCYSDSNFKGLTGYYFGSNSMTPAMCASSCKDLGFSLAGTAVGRACYCGNTWAAGQLLPDSSCSTACMGDSKSFCGGGSQVSLYDATKAPAVPTALTQYGFKGCYSDSASARTLPAYSYASSAMTIPLCKAACNNKGYSLAGVENGNQCFCDNTQKAGSRVAWALCSTPCSGDSTSTCGSANIIGIFNSNATAPTNGTTNSTAPATGAALGCFSDINTINGRGFTSDAMTVNLCQQNCLASNNSYAGLLYGNRCVCGNTRPGNLVDSSSCASPCTGQTGITCGGANSIQAFDLKKSSVSSNYDNTSNSTGYIGCYSVGTNPPILGAQTFNSQSMTREMCMASCGQFGYQYAALRNGNQCQCGNQLDKNSLGYKVQPSNCNVRCAGNSLQFCGTSTNSQVYQVSKTGVAPYSNTVEGYKGCFAPGTVFTSPQYFTSDNTMTGSLCRQICRNKQMSVAALTNGYQCACASSVTYGAAQSLALCNLPCRGNANETCGAASYVSVYDTTGPGSLPPTGPAYPTGYLGCFSTDLTNLKSYNYTSGAMTVELCSSVCKGKGFSMFGVQRTTCQCGTSMPTQQMSNSYCNAYCPGSGNVEFCGASGKISVFTTNPNSAPASQVASSSGAGSSSSSSSPSSASSSAPSSSASRPASASSAASVPASVSSSAPTSTTSKASASSTLSVRSTSNIGDNGVVTNPVTNTPSGSGSTTSNVATSAGPASGSAAPASASSASPASASSAAPASSQVASSTTSTTPAPSASSDPNVLGCFKDPQSVLTKNAMSCTSLTPTMCRLWCNLNKYTYAAVGGGNTCSCFDDNSSLVSTQASDCSSPCVGNSTLTCGGPSAANVFKSVDTAYTLQRNTAINTKRALERNMKRIVMRKHKH